MHHDRADTTVRASLMLWIADERYREAREEAQDYKKAYERQVARNRVLRHLLRRGEAAPERRNA